MELVLVERQFDEPGRFEDIQSLEDEGSWCLDAYGVRFLKTFFSRDRRRMWCLYEAPDAEAVRLAETQAKVPFDRVWSCTNLRNEGHSDPMPDLEFVVVERRFDTPVTADVISNVARRVGSCLHLHRASYVESFVRKDGLEMVCIFRAPDAEAVRLANDQAAVAYSGVWTANVFKSDREAR